MKEERSRCASTVCTPVCIRCLHAGAGVGRQFPVKPRFVILVSGKYRAREGECGFRISNELSGPDTFDSTTPQLVLCKLIL